MADIAMTPSRWARGLQWLQAALGRPGAEAASPAAQAQSHAPWEVLAAKIVFSHARNRQQLLGPPPTAFGQLDDSQTELLIHAAAAAAQAGGPLDDAAERRLRGVLSSAGLQSATDGFLDRALRQPETVDTLMRGARDPHLGSLVYAASLLAADKHDEAGQAWLLYLARRLRLPADIVIRLHNQFGVAAGPE